MPQGIIICGCVGMVDELVLETSVNSCRFKSCHPHQNKRPSIRMVFYFGFVRKDLKLKKARGVNKTIDDRF